MRKFILLTIIATISTLSSMSSYAEVFYPGTDEDLYPTTELYRFHADHTNSPDDFLDYFIFTVSTPKDFIFFSPTFSGTSFNSVSLYSGTPDGPNVFLKNGDTFNSSNYSYSIIGASSLTGNYFVKLNGSPTGNAQYDASISLVPPLPAIPEPAVFELLLIGLGFLGQASISGMLNYCKRTCRKLRGFQSKLVN